MARRIQHMGEKLIESDGGLGWTRERASVASVSSGRYVTELFGITYELEKRHRNTRIEPGADTGWYLYNKGPQHGFFGEWCAPTIMEAVDEADKLIRELDLRGPGYEPKEKDSD